MIRVGQHGLRSAQTPAGLRSDPEANPRTPSTERLDVVNLSPTYRNRPPDSPTTGRRTEAARTRARRAPSRQRETVPGTPGRTGLGARSVWSGAVFLSGRRVTSPPPVG
ncbi:hypothetical protein [Streptomyces phaeochromogenes]